MWKPDKSKEELVDDLKDVVEDLFYYINAEDYKKFWKLINKIDGDS